MMLPVFYTPSQMPLISCDDIKPTCL